MLKMFSKRMNNKKGFTLIELIVVIAILGILAGIAVPKFGGFTDKAKAQADATACKTIQTAVLAGLASGNSFYKVEKMTWTNKTSDFSGANIEEGSGGNEPAAKDELANLLGNEPPKSQVKNTDGFTVTIDENGDVTVTTTKTTTK
jgi:type IV pilus assembly protein PilA